MSQRLILRLFLTHFRPQRRALSAKFDASNDLGAPIVQAMRENLDSPDSLAQKCLELSSISRKLGVRQITNSIQSVIAAMDAHPNSVALQLHGSTTLWDLVASAPGIQSKDAITRILKALQLHPHNALLQLQGCSALREMISSTEQRNMFLKSNGVELVVAALKTHMMDVSLQYRACDLLITLEQFPACRAAFMKSDGLQHVVAMLNAHPHVGILQKQGVSLLNHIALSPNHERSGRQLLADDLLVVVAKAVATSMRSHARDASVQELGCAALQRALVAIRDPACVDSIRTHGVIEILLATLVAHPMNMSLLVNGLQALKRFLHVPCAEAVATFVAKGGVRCVVAAMQKHPSHEGVVHHGSELLGDIAGDRAGADVVAMEGGIACIVAAMKSFPKSEPIQLNGSMAVTILDADAVVAAGGVEVVMSAMASFQGKEQLQSYGIDALVRLGALEMGGWADVLPKAIERIVASMRAHRSSLDMQQRGCEVLLAVVMNEDERGVGIVAKAGGIECISQAMHRHMHIAELQQVGCAALMSIALNKSAERSDEILRVDGIVRIIKAMRSHPQVLDLQTNGCWAIRNIACNAKSASEIEKAGGLECIFEVMRTHLVNPQLQQDACTALASIAMNGVRKANVVENILALLRCYPSHEGVQQHALAVLFFLVDSSDLCAQLSWASRMGTIAAVRFSLKNFAAHESMQMYGNKILEKLDRVVDARPHGEDTKKS